MKQETLSANAITAELLLRIYETYGKSACIQRVNVIAMNVERGGSKRFVRSCQPGTADILGCIAGRPVAIEVKAGRDKQSAKQKDFQAAWERAGGLYFIARDVTECMVQIGCRVSGSRT